LKSRSISPVTDLRQTKEKFVFETEFHAQVECSTAVTNACLPECAEGLPGIEGTRLYGSRRASRSGGRFDETTESADHRVTKRQPRVFSSCVRGLGFFAAVTNAILGEWDEPGIFLNT
jgi:hypothetical protein